MKDQGFGQHQEPVQWVMRPCLSHKCMRLALVDHTSHHTCCTTMKLVVVVAVVVQGDNQPLSKPDGCMMPAVVHRNCCHIGIVAFVEYHIGIVVVVESLVRHSTHLERFAQYHKDLADQLVLIKFSYLTK